MDLSVVIPLFNEEESLAELVHWINRVVEENKIKAEIILIDDGSSDASWEIVEELSQTFPHLVGIKFRRNYGKSAALNVGFKQAVGRVVITMDADLQDSPDEIPALMDAIDRQGYDLVSGWKKNRHDPISKTLPSKFFNRITRWISKIKLHDFNCGLKAYRLDVVKSVEVYGEMHRYIPLLAKWAGFYKIGEQVVKHYPRKYGVSKFGFERFINGFLDLLSITFVGKFAKRPMHFFGALGTLFLIVGFAVLSALTINKLVYNQGGIAERPLFFLGFLILIIGTQLFVTGFLAELVVRSNPERNNYLIEKTTGVEHSQN
ncbi:MAG: glycosyltransferase family 2 protein [Saprospiraceae bacterium]